MHAKPDTTLNCDNSTKPHIPFFYDIIKKI